MNRRILLLITVLIMLVSLTVCSAQDEAAAEKAAVSAETSGSEEAEEDPRVKMILSYQKEEEEDPFLVSTYLNMPGFFFNIASPVIEGYWPDTQRLTGQLTGDFEKTIFYHLGSYTLTVHYRLLNGRTAAPDYQSSEQFGDEYTVRSPYAAGYKPVTKEVSGVMPGRDVELTVFYVDWNAVIE